MDFLSHLIFEAVILSLVSLLCVFVGRLVAVAFRCACVISVSASLCVGWLSGIVQVRVRSGRRVAWGRGCWVAMCLRDSLSLGGGNCRRGGGYVGKMGLL